MNRFLSLRLPRYFPSIASLSGSEQHQGGASHSPTLSKNNNGSSSSSAAASAAEQAALHHQHRKEAKLMASLAMKTKAEDNTPIGLQGLSKAAADLGADLSSSGSAGANRLSSALLYQPYDAISKELGVGLSPAGCGLSGEKGSGGTAGNGMGGGMNSMNSAGMLSAEDGRARPDGGGGGHASRRAQAQKPHIKKPLNAFMLYMKDMRANVVAECTLKESAAINQILGRRVSWGGGRRKIQVLIINCLFVSSSGTR